MRQERQPVWSSHSKKKQREMRGRISFLRKVIGRDGAVRILTPEEAKAAELTRKKQSEEPSYIDINKELLDGYRMFLEAEKTARLQSPHFINRQRRGTAQREDVQARAARIDLIVKRIVDSDWRRKSATWIAQRLALELGRSANTLRTDVAVAKKILMGSQLNKK